MILNQDQIMFFLLALLGCDTVTELAISIFKVNIVTWTAQRSLNTHLRGDITGVTAVATQQ
jgi:hypothetical protein